MFIVFSHIIDWIDYYSLADKNLLHYDRQNWTKMFWEVLDHLSVEEKQ